MTGIIIAGPGRAGLALGLAAAAAHHEIVAVTARSLPAAQDAAQRLDSRAVAWGHLLPAADLLVVAVRDDAIAAVAEQLAPAAGDIRLAVHLSGLTPVGALRPLEVAGVETGSFHPLQTLPTADLGAARLAGAFAAITGDDRVAGRLEALAGSLGMHPFRLADDDKPLYHAAAAAAANFPLAALAMASDLFEAAGVPFEAAAPLVRAIVDNTFELGPRAALTGPVARGDAGTVAAQIAAVRSAAPEWQAAFTDFVTHLATISGRSQDLREVIG